MSDDHNTRPGTPGEGGPQPPQYRYNQAPQDNPWGIQSNNSWATPASEQQPMHGGYVGDAPMGVPEEPERRGPNYLVIFLVVLAVLAVAGFGYFVYSGTNRDAGEDASSSVSREESPGAGEESEEAEASQLEEDAEKRKEEQEKKEEEEARESEAAERPSNPRLPGDAVAVNESAKGSHPGGDLNSVWKSGPTSDDFAEDVRDAYVDAYLDGKPDEFNHVVEVYSPVTGQSYSMNCRDNGRYVHCTGGNNANVYIA